jgi:lipoprotein-releasing system ATP-binding protein
MSATVIKCEDLVKTYTEGPSHVEVLNGLNLSIYPGERVAVMGASGAGKSTLLHLLGGLDLPTSGNIELDGQHLSQLTDKARGELRNKSLGFVYQFHHLLPEFTVQENVAVPLWIAGVDRDEAMKSAGKMLDAVGLGPRQDHRPSELSGGERQRGAMARALVTSPRCVLADEPTGNLDRRTADRVFDLMLELNRDSQTALLMATHDHALAHRMDRVLTIEDGRILE